MDGRGKRGSQDFFCKFRKKITHIIPIVNPSRESKASPSIPRRGMPPRLAVHFLSGSSCHEPIREKPHCHTGMRDHHGFLHFRRREKLLVT